VDESVTTFCMARPRVEAVVIICLMACRSNASQTGAPDGVNMVVDDQPSAGRSGEVAVHSESVPVTEAVAAPPATVAPAATVTPASSGDRVVLDLADRRLVVTLGDAQKLKVMLISRIEESTLEDRDALLSATRHLDPTIFEGVMRIGNWLLQPSGSRLAFTYRMPAEPGGMRAYRAEVVKTGESWVVKGIGAGIIHRR